MFCCGNKIVSQRFSVLRREILNPPVVNQGLFACTACTDVCVSVDCVRKAYQLIRRNFAIPKLTVHKNIWPLSIYIYVYIHTYLEVLYRCYIIKTRRAHMAAVLHMTFRDEMFVT